MIVRNPPGQSQTTETVMNFYHLNNEGEPGEVIWILSVFSIFLIDVNISFTTKHHPGNTVKQFILREIEERTAKSNPIQIFENKKCIEN